MGSGIKYEGGEIKIDIDYLLSAMNEDDQKAFVKAFAVQRNIIEHVIDSICGEDPDCWWSSYDNEDRMRMFKRVEKAQLKKWSTYNWEFITEAKDRLKEIREKQRVYWALFHGEFREHLWDDFSQFCKRNGITSEYTTELANEDIARVEKIVKDALDKMAKAIE